MPIKIPSLLPAAEVLEKENIFIMDELRASAQDIRPLRIAILNLMPTKIVTETQLLRLLSNTPIQLDITLLTTSTYASKNTPAEHLSSFYTTFEEIKEQKFDGFIITGAPVELMDFEQVDYWDELCEIMRWTKRNVFSTMYLCWAAMAGLYCHYGVGKRRLAKKISGVFLHQTLLPSHPLLRGFDGHFYAPHSRYAEVCSEDLTRCGELVTLSASDKAGLYLAASKNGRSIFVLGHSEYDTDTLKTEYFRDLAKGISPELPENYFKNNDAKAAPQNRWRAHAHLLFANWLNYFVYQSTPYNLDDLT